MAYKLHYFNITARGEPIRWLFKYGGIEFEDIRIELKDWPEVKKTMPFGQVPMLEIGDKKFVQSLSMARYLAKKVGLAGDNDLENLEIESIVETINDFMLKIVPTAWLDDEVKKAEEMAKLKAEVIPFYLSKFDAIAAANGDFMACKKMTFADIGIAALKDYLNWIIKDDFNDYAAYPHLHAIVEKVCAIESIKKWIEERPVTMC